MSAPMWQVRPSGETHEGKQVPLAVLRQAIEDDLVGDWDEVRGPGESEWQPVTDHPTASEFLVQTRRPLSREVDEAESDMTPMIDVTFQLVIFFMIAATYTIQKTLDLPRTNPDPSGAVTIDELEQENIIVRIASDGGIEVDEQAVALEDLIASLREATRARRSAELVLDVDDEAAHDVVVQVIDAAGAANIEKVLFVSRVES